MYSSNIKIAKKEADNSFYFFRLIKHSYNEISKPVIPVYPSYERAAKAIANIIGCRRLRHEAEG